MAIISTFDSGDTIRFENIFSVSGTNTDPTTVTFRIRDPNKVVTSYVYGTDVELVKVATGQYRIDLQLDLPGEYFYRWESGGPIAPGAAESRIKITRSQVIG